MKLHAIIEKYISYRQNTGEKFQRESDILKMFCNWIGKDAPISAINENICVNFMLGIKHSITPVSDRKYTVLKGLFEWLIIRGFLSESPLPVERPKPSSPTQTYIYSTDELYRIFNGARKYLKNLRKNYVECFEVIFKLTYVLGLRINETLSLRIEDINLKEQVIIIKESKFYKTRLTPFNAEVKLLLENFMVWRKRKGMSLDSKTNLFLTPQGLQVTYPNTLWAFKVILANEGITGRSDSEFGPRIHDLRASFAVHRLVEWYNQGEDVQLLLPYLSTYMGHDQLSHTSVYLSFKLRFFMKQIKNLNPMQIKNEKTNNEGLLSPWLKRFLCEYIPCIRNLSANTLKSYRDTFRLLLPKVAKNGKKRVDELFIEDITAECTKSFLQKLESIRGCSISTRNQRLAAIHSFANYIAIKSPEHLEWCRNRLNIPIKKHAATLITYLEKEEMDAMLNAPDQNNSLGYRDYTLLLFLYNTGARADEVANLQIEALSLSLDNGNIPMVTIKGKGNKSRRCPLWKIL